MNKLVVVLGIVAERSHRMQLGKEVECGWICDDVIIRVVTDG